MREGAPPQEEQSPLAGVQVHVFAYGSNLCVERMAVRTPGARVIAVGVLGGHALRWHKKGGDGSGKCDALATGDDRDAVHGVVYEMGPADKTRLDRIEGLGEHYFEKRIVIGTTDGDSIDALVYVANPRRIDATARPYRWYTAFVIAGANRHGLPADYIAALEAVEAIDDPDPVRAARESAVLG